MAGRLKKVLGAGAVLVAAGGAFVWTKMALTRDPNEIALGAGAPAVSLLDAAGQPFDMAALASQGLPVLVFYRGHW